jgi:hypothetical protein
MRNPTSSTNAVACCALSFRSWQSGAGRGFCDHCRCDIGGQKSRGDHFAGAACGPICQTVSLALARDRNQPHQSRQRVLIRNYNALSLSSRPRHELRTQPSRPRRHRHLGEHRKSGGRPPDHVTAGGADIDSGCNPPGATSHPLLMLEKQVKAATASSMDTCRRQAMFMLGKPALATVAPIYIQNIEARNRASRNADQGTRVFFP